jgi:hypothetical protein
VSLHVAAISSIGFNYLLQPLPLPSAPNHQRCDDGKHDCTGKWCYEGKAAAVYELLEDAGIGCSDGSTRAIATFAVG